MLFPDVESNFYLFLLAKESVSREGKRS